MMISRMHVTPIRSAPDSARTAQTSSALPTKYLPSDPDCSSDVPSTTHAFDSTGDLFDEVVRARIFAGFHYRHTVIDGGRLGTHVTRQLLRRHFRRLRRESSIGAWRV